MNRYRRYFMVLNCWLYLERLKTDGKSLHTTGIAWHPKSGLPLSRNLCVPTHVHFMRPRKKAQAMYEASRVNVKVERFSFNVYARPFSHHLSLFYMQEHVNFTLFNLLTLPSHKSLWLSFTVLSYRLRNSTYRALSFLKRFSGVTEILVMLFLESSLKEIVMQFSKVVFPKVIRWNLL